MKQRAKKKRNLVKCLYLQGDHDGHKVLILHHGSFLGWMSKSVFLKSQKAFILALNPLRQISADRNKAKDVLALNSSSLLMEISCASLLWFCKHFFSYTARWRENKGCESSLFNVHNATLLNYRPFFSFSWLRYIWWNSRSLYESALGWKILASKNTERWFYNNPRAWISSLASGTRLEHFPGCSHEISWRTDSI